MKFSIIAFVQMVFSAVFFICLVEPSSKFSPVSSGMLSVLFAICFRKERRTYTRSRVMKSRYTCTKDIAKELNKIFLSRMFGRSFRHRKNIIDVGKLTFNIASVVMSHICFTMFLNRIKNMVQQAPTTRLRRKHGRTIPTRCFCGWRNRERMFDGRRSEPRQNIWKMLG